MTTDLTDLPKRARLRVQCFETIASEVKAIVSDIRAKSDVAEISYVRMDQATDKKDLIPICKDILLSDLTNVEYQGKLITEFLEKKLEITNQTKIDDILKVNRETNLLIKRDEFARNLKWKPIRFEFDNMFSYGEGNVLDFTQASGVYGIFGPNKSGKSCLLSAMTFCLFDKFDRGFKGIHVRNVEKSGFRCKFELEIAGVRYFIERIGETTRAGNVKVGVRFWRVINGMEEELHGNARRDTNEVIRDYIGTYEDFVLTTLSVQTAKNNISFIDMGNTERKDLLVQFIGLNVFDRLSEAASERNKELNALLKIHKDKNYAYDRSQFENALIQAESFFTEENAIVENLRKQMTDVNEQVVKESANLIRLDDNVPTNLASLDSHKTAAETAVRQKKQSIDTCQTSIQTLEAQIAEFDRQIGDIEASDLVESHKTYLTISNRIAEVKQQRELKRVEVREKLDKVERLKNHKYDPNCKFCIDNDFVRDATKAKIELVKDKKETDKIVTTLDALQTEFEKYKWVEQAYERYTKLLTDRSKVKDELSRWSQKFIIARNELEKLDINLKKETHQVELYHRNEVSVQHNEKINTNVSAFRTAYTKLDVEFQKRNRTLMDINGKIQTFKAKIKELTDTIEELKKLEYEFDLYQNYMTAVGRDGIPYQVICNTVPEIESEVNSILSQVVEYTIEFETDGKNVVPYIVYDQRKWPIEMSSGFERFVASIAIRVALTNISNLPKTTFLALDEGFGTLDGDNLASMFTLFSFLKGNFDFILVVSHIDALKDAVDKQIEIKVDGNFSKVVFE
jgi:DNA repair exonuclease SbcCD ATPase subunit